MAEAIISPGVYARENDISFINPAPVAAGAAFIGPTVKGPVEEPTIVTSYSDYLRTFGETITSGSKQYEYLTSVAVKGYFQQGGNTALITRIVSRSADYTRAANTILQSGILATTASLVISSASLANFITPSGSFSINGVTLAVTSSTTQTNTSTTMYVLQGASPANTVTNIVASINTSASNALYSTNLQYITASANSTTGVNLFTTSSLLGTGTVSSAILNAYTYVSGSVTTLFSGATGTAPFTVETLGKGVNFNNAAGPFSATASNAAYNNTDGSLVSGSADNVRWEISGINNAAGTFSLIVRRGDDNTNNKTILETFNNLSLDPNSPNYIESVIGNQYTTVATDSTSGVSYNYKVGNYPNTSKYIRVSGVSLPTNYYLTNDGVTVNVNTNGLSYSASLPIVSSGSFYNATGNNVSAVGAVTWFQDIASAATNVQGVVGASYNTAISLLSNKDDYQFNIIATPGLIATNTTAGANTAINSVIALAENRGDCIAVVDLVPTGSTVGAVTTQAAGFNSSYAATYWPWIQVRSATGRNEWSPAGTLVPGIYAFTDAIAAPWFAPAGLVRGGIPGVIQAERKITKGERDTLYAGKVNPIATFPGSGIAVFGQKTLQTKASALDRVNVRRLLISLKKFIGDQARTLVFEQNTLTTRNKFLSAVNPYLQSVVERQGLYAFRVVMDDTNNTADSIDRNQLNGQILIQPTKTVEFVVLDFTIAPTGATFA
jgi:phage tail sheath protein FI